MTVPTEEAREAIEAAMMLAVDDAMILARRRLAGQEPAPPMDPRGRALLERRKGLARPTGWISRS
jgi:hypothetical protein